MLMAKNHYKYISNKTNKFPYLYCLLCDNEQSTKPERQGLPKRKKEESMKGDVFVSQFQFHVILNRTFR